MRQKLLILALFSLTNVAAAAGVIGTKASFSEGSFCKTIHCEFFGKKVLDSDAIVYVYNGPFGAMAVTRNSKNIITRGTTYLKSEIFDLEGNDYALIRGYLNEYFKYFTGNIMTESDFNRCHTEGTVRRKATKGIIYCASLGDTYEFSARDK